MATPTLEQMVRGLEKALVEKLGEIITQYDEADTLFSCPICGSNKYEGMVEYRKSSPDIIGPSNTFTKIVIGYCCSGCSVRFGDPAKFSKNRESAPK